jgi:hypothetical protein
VGLNQPIESVVIFTFPEALEESPKLKRKYSSNTAVVIIQFVKLHVKMAEKETKGQSSKRPELRRQRERTRSDPESREFEDFCSFPSETLRRHTLLSSEFQNRPKLKTAKDKKHDVFSTLQETLEVLRDEADTTSRDSHKRDDLWCHPFEIPEHPIGQNELRSVEIDLERQHSKIMRASSLTSLDEKMFASKEGSHDLLPIVYQRLSISGANTSGVSLDCTFRVPLH